MAPCRTCLLSLFCFLNGASGLVNRSHTDNVIHLYTNGSAELNKAFEAVYNHFEKTFDFKLYAQSMDEFRENAKIYRTSDAYSSYTYYPDRPHCDKGVVNTASLRAAQSSGIAAFPGGPVKKLLGTDLSKSLTGMAEGAQGPAAGGLLQPTILAKQALQMGAGMVQAIVAAVVSIVPPLIPPPVWNNMPLVCAPMVTGHNCFGAVLYPITMADFLIADVTDRMLDGYIAGFPNTYASKVGQTSDKMYKSCFASYMSMMCSSIFPRCTIPQSRDEPVPIGGRVPMCFHLCVLPLVACPGFWMGDLIGSCSMVSVPPMCTQAFYWNMWKLPPQYVSFDHANPFPKNCPTAVSGMDAADDLELYDEVSEKSAPGSPILKEAAAVAALPPVRS